MFRLGPVGNLTEGGSWDGIGLRDVYQLFISYDSQKIVGLQVQYIDEVSSSLVLSDLYGNMSGSNFRAIKFNYPSEYITWLKMEGSSSGVNWLAMKTNLGKWYGPFPAKSQTGFNLGKENQFGGFHGTANPTKLDESMLATGFYLGEENQFGGFHGTANPTTGLRSLGIYVQPVSSLDTTVADISSHVAGEEALKIE